MIRKMMIGLTLFMLIQGGLAAEIKWHKSFPEAVKQAQQSNKPILAVFR